MESLASVDTICVDKTGTLTEDRLRVVELVAADDADEGELSVLLGRYAASSPSRNSTLEAIAGAYPGTAEPVRRGRAVLVAAPLERPVDGRPRYVLGAPEHFALGAPCRSAPAGRPRRGRRVLAFAVGDAALSDPGAESPPPSGLRPMGLVVLAEELRPDARETVAFLLEQGVELKVISGDAPATVAAIAADAGIPVHGEPVDGRELPADATPRARAGRARRRSSGGSRPTARSASWRRWRPRGATSAWSATASTTSRR